MEYTKEFDALWNEIAPVHRMLQKKQELFGLYKIIMAMPRRENALEIGCLQGATAVFFSKLFKNVYSIDNVKRYKGDKPFNFILGDTHIQGTIDKVYALKKKFDLIMIDGDHTYSGVKMDFENYCQFAGKGALIIFHDILITKWHINQNCEVGKYWDEIKGNFKVDEICYTDDYIEPNPLGGWVNDLHPSKWGGIGVIHWEVKSGDVVL